MKPKSYNKREFLKILGLGSLGVLFWQCYDFKKEGENELLTESDSEPKSNSNPDTKLNFTEKDVIFITRNDEKYDSLRQGFNKRFDKFPKTIALCLTTKGVQAAILKAKSDGLKISVKSGGHSFEAFSCGNDSLLINLSQMNKIQWLESDKVMLQPACLLQEIYTEFLPKRRIIPAGSCGTVGIGGLTLGGGYGFFSRKHGLTCDNLIQVKLVDGNGYVQDSDKNPDLLWACRGGGNGNFGVVTEMYFKTHEAPDSFSSYRLKFRNLNEERFMQLIRTWFSFSGNLREEAFSAFVLNGKTLTVLITNYQKHSSGFESTFSGLRSLSDEYKPTYNQPLANALKRYYGRKDPLYFKNASAGLYKGIEEIESVLPQVFEKVIANPGMIYQINTLGGNIQNPDFEKNSAYPHRQFTYLSELQSYWDNPSQEKKFISAFEEIQNLFRSSGVSAQYRNYPDINFPDWETAYYGNNYAKLQEIKSKLDPDDLFRFEQSVRL